MRFPDLSTETLDELVCITFNEVVPAGLFTQIPETRVAEWLKAVAKTHDHRIVQLDFIICSDEYLYELNVAHLEHDTLTDIITFDLTDPDEDHRLVEGECYISQARVEENAARFGESPTSEMLRVFAHGLLHLCGLGDKTPREIECMRTAEADALANWMPSS